MPLNPLIPLGVQTTNIGQQLQQFAGQKKAAEAEQARADRENRLLDLKVSEAEAAETLRLQSEEIRSKGIFGRTAGALLDQGDDAAFRSTVERRIEENTARGIESPGLTKMLQEFDAGNKPLVRQVLKQRELDARSRDLIPKVEDESFTLSQGQTRFDEQGRPIASVAPKPEKATEREIKIQGLTDRGLNRDDAADLVEGRIRLTAPDEFGNVFKVNLATGEKEQVIGETDITDVPEPVDLPESDSVFEAAERGTGPFRATLQGFSNLFGFLVEGQLAPETTQARQKLNLFNKTAQEALIQNPKFPIAEQKFVESLLPSTKQIFKDPDDAVSNLTELKNHLESRIQSSERSIASGQVTEKRKGELANQVDNMKRVLSLMGEPTQERTSELARKVADGSATDDEIEEYLSIKGAQ